VYVVGGRRGLILIPKGCGGRGWSGFATELRKVKAFFDAPVGIGATTVSQHQVRGGSFSSGKEASLGAGGRSYMEVVRMK
jgi:hypothetical protein